MNAYHASLVSTFKNTLGFPCSVEITHESIDGRTVVFECDGGSSGRGIFHLERQEIIRFERGGDSGK